MTDQNLPLLTLRLFGPFEARVSGEPLPRLRTRKGQWLLALLALRPGRAVEREWLAGLLWPESTERAAFASLRNSLLDLRQALGPASPRLQAPGARTLLLQIAPSEADVVAFDAAIARGDEAALEEAVALYRGPLLEGCVEEWAFQERQIRAESYLKALEQLAAGAMARGEPGVAEQHLRRAVAVDPLRESAQQRLMHALAERGDYAAAFQLYRELRLHLHRELNAEPDGETHALFEQIRAEARRRAGGRRPTTDDRPRTTARAYGDGGEEPALETPSVGGRSSVVGRRPCEATVTFLFTDIEGSTNLWEQHPQAMREAMQRHDLLLRTAIEGHGGQVFKTVGDQFCAAFATAPDALAAALAAQQALVVEVWGAIGPLRVRMALYTGIAQERDGDYSGPPLNRVARLLDAGHGGQILLSLATQELACNALPEGTTLRDLGPHRLRDLQRPEHLFQLLHPDLPGDLPPLLSLDALPNNLPLQVTSFVGRDKEMAEVKRLLGTTRLLTLTGTGGTGKTRLALQMAADLLQEYPDGVWLVELAPLADPALVPQVVASVLAVREEPERPITQTLAEALQPKKLLLLLDNCEHLLAACAALADALLRACPGVQILTTSREGLNITGEQTYRVPSLALPDLRDLPPLERLHQFGALRLFVDRAALGQPAFAMTPANMVAVARVCHRLDGIPLAIELAAARVKALAVEQIAQRLDDRFRLLTGGSRTALPRQQTLRALIDWSYDLLSERERALLPRLSVFAGGWILEAAEAVCGDDQRRTTNDQRQERDDTSGVGHSSFVVRRDEVLDLLTGLVDKSLVIYEAGDGDARYRLLETVRQYARDRLLEGGDAAVRRRRHRYWYLALVEQAEAECERTGDWLCMDRLEAEHDNLRAALSWATETGDGETGLRLATGLWGFWGTRRHWAEAREALGTLRELGDRYHSGWALAHLGEVADARADYHTAMAHLEDSMAVWRAMNYRFGIHYVLHKLGWVAKHQGNWQTARSRFAESLRLSRQHEMTTGSLLSLEGLAEVAGAQGEPERAARLLGAVEGLGEVGRSSLPADQGAEDKRCAEAARAALGEAAFAAAWAEGRAMTLQQAADCALEVEPPQGAGPGREGGDAVDTRRPG